MRTNLLYLLLALPVMWSSCASTKEIKEDYRTETYKNRTAHFAENPLKTGQIVFFGNSITQAGEWQQYFPHSNVANRGISGDNTEGMLARIDEIIASQPDKFFIMAGINDISLSRSNKTIIENYAAIIDKIKTNSPQTKIYIQSVLPINNDFAQYKRLSGKEDQVTQLNALLRLLAQSKDVNYIHLFPFFTDAEGKLKKEFTGDGLHLSPEAYRVWANVIHRFVE